MKNMDEVMNAFARFMDKPRNPAYAVMELMEALSKHGHEALKEFDAWQQEYDYMENENAMLRKMLREAGIVYKPGDAA